MTNAKGIFQIIKGLKIPFMERPHQKQPFTKTKMSWEERNLVQTEFKKLLKKGAIATTQGSKEPCFSNFFLRLKENVFAQL